MASEDETAVAYLRSPLAIRARCENILEKGFAGELEHFAIEMTEMPRVIDEVVAVTQSNYPTLAVPVHGRINHFRAGGIDRVAALEAKLACNVVRPSPIACSIMPAMSRFAMCSSRTAQ